ncbi:cytochrome c oxidase assembly protein [Aureimonas sp. AU12]|uniref:cytochrome c oxidase assembly protein n=1 Tax=Aureimonas sp. AU12 TaxID=1638161 RepID=UPI0007814971|nr:cytochrome c oxidase assembly protein [Aureimonas sp. AU12]
MPEPWTATVPYCGQAPLPGELLRAWNLDPMVIGALAVASIAGFVLLRKRDDARLRWHGLAMLVLALAFISPLCALSSALFSARVAHHLLLISVAAPLLALAFPGRRPAPAARLPLLVLAHVVAVWVWHAPAPYAAAMASDAVYWVMEATLLGTGWLVWRDLMAASTPPLRAGLAHLTLIALMGLLGALITFAPVPLYALHFLSTDPFGVSALEDQQLAGLLMWVPAIVPNLVAALLCLRRLVDAAPSAGVSRA